jgi:Flp pilus assembly protein CpaB
LAVAPAATRPRPGGGRLFIIIGVLLALVAFGAVFLLGSVGGGGSIGGGPSTTVVIAARSIPLRHQLSASDVEIAKASVNGNATLQNTYGATNDVMGLVSELNITKGAIITSDMLARDINLVPSGAAPAYLPLASGYVAMTIPTGEMQGVAGHISTGDYITVIASANVQIFVVSGSGSSGPAATGSVSKTVFTNVRIIGLGPASAGVQSANSANAPTTTNGGGQNTGITSSLTIEMTQCDAEYFTWFLANTQVRYTLESYKDYLATPPSNPDPTCPTVTAAGGVGPKQVEARYHFTTLVTGR